MAKDEDFVGASLQLKTKLTFLLLLTFLFKAGIEGYDALQLKT